MKRVQPAAVLLMLTVAITLIASPAVAAVDIERHGEENPVAEIAKSTFYGALAGVVIGGAIEAADNGSDDGEAFRWCFVGGTFIGLAAGIYFTARRPSPTPVFEFGGGRLHVGALAPEPVRGGARLRVIGTRF